MLRVSGSTASGPALSVHEAINAGDAGPIAVRGWPINDAAYAPRVCDSTLANDPPQCAPPYLLVEGLDFATLPNARTKYGVAHTTVEVVLQGTLSDPSPGSPYACGVGSEPEPWETHACINGQWVITRDPAAPSLPVGDVRCLVTKAPEAGGTPRATYVAC